MGSKSPMINTAMVFLIDKEKRHKLGEQFLLLFQCYLVNVKVWVWWKVLFFKFVWINLWDKLLRRSPGYWRRCSIFASCCNRLIRFRRRSLPDRIRGRPLSGARPCQSHRRTCPRSNRRLTIRERLISKTKFHCLRSSLRWIITGLFCEPYLLKF